MRILREITRVFTLLMLTAGLAGGSGTYRPPGPPNRQFHGYSRDDLGYGKVLFTGHKLTGIMGSSCVACHGRGASNPLRRSSLKRQSEILPDLINQCLSKEDRSNGRSIEIGSKEAKSLGAFLISKYRLPVKAIRYFKTPIIKQNPDSGVSWVITPVVNEKNGIRQVAIDAAGSQPVYYYIDGAGKSLNHIVGDDRKLIVTIFDGQDIVCFGSVRQQNMPHIFYGVRGPGDKIDLMHGRLQPDSAWAIKKIRLIKAKNCYLTAVLGSQKDIWIAYINPNSDKIHIGMPESDIWETFAVKDGGSLLSITGAVDPVSRTPHFIYNVVESTIKKRRKTGRLNHLYLDGENWNTEIVDGEGNVGQRPDMAFAFDGSLHVSYGDADRGIIKYAVRRNGIWTIFEDIDLPSGKGRTGEFSAIQVDPDGNPHLVYNYISYGPNDEVRYARYISGKWIVSVVDNKGKIGANIDFFMDKSRTSHLVYSNYERGTLFYAQGRFH